MPSKPWGCRSKTLTPIPERHACVATLPPSNCARHSIS